MLKALMLRPCKAKRLSPETMRRRFRNHSLHVGVTQGTLLTMMLMRSKDCDLIAVES